MVTSHRRRQCSHTGEKQRERKKQKLREAGTNNPCNTGMKGHRGRRGQQTHCPEQLLDSISALRSCVSTYAPKQMVGFSQELGMLRKCGFECPRGSRQITG